MLRFTQRFSKRALMFSGVAATLTVSAAGAATFHRLAITQTGGSLGATTFLQSSATSSALQGEVASSANTAIKLPFGVLGEYNAAGSTFGIGVLGISTTGYAVAGESLSGQPSILGYEGTGGGSAIEAAAPAGTSAVAIDVEANNGYDGVYVNSSNNGTAFAANASSTNEDSGQGLFATDDSADASAVAANNYQQTFPSELDNGGGVYATAQGPGIFSESYSDPGIATQFDCDAYADSNGSFGGLGDQTCAGLYVVQNGTKGWPILVYNPVNSTYPFYVDADGNVYATGTFQANSIVTRNKGTDLMTYASKQTEKTVEDFGTARLQNGSADVALQSDFRSTIDTTQPYMVFMTPHGDNNGLYVASTTARGFTIRESHGGRSALTFDYRIVARPIGERLARMPRFTADAATPHTSGIRTAYISPRMRAATASQRHHKESSHAIIPTSLFRLR